MINPVINILKCFEMYDHYYDHRSDSSNDSDSNSYYYDYDDEAHYYFKELETTIFNIRHKSLNNICGKNYRHQQCLHLPISFIKFEIEFTPILLILDSLAPILVISPHLLRMLMGTCKTLYMYFSNYEIPSFEITEFLMDALDYNCKSCITNLRAPCKLYGYGSEIVKYAFKNGLCGIKLLPTSYLNSNEIMECAQNIIKHPNSYELVEHLSTNYNITPDIFTVIEPFLNYNKKIEFITQ